MENFLSKSYGKKFCNYKNYTAGDAFNVNCTNLLRKNCTVKQFGPWLILLCRLSRIHTHFFIKILRKNRIISISIKWGLYFKGCHSPDDEEYHQPGDMNAGRILFGHTSYIYRCLPILLPTFLADRRKKCSKASHA